MRKGMRKMMFGIKSKLCVRDKVGYSFIQTGFQIPGFQPVGQQKLKF